MSIVDINPNDFVQRGGVKMQQLGSDDALHVEFKSREIVDKANSTEDEVAYKMEEYAMVTVPSASDGPPKTIIRVDIESAKKRWPNQYSKWKGLIKGPAGTPLSEWPELRAADVISFKAGGVHTVEQVASLSDSQTLSLGMGSRKRRDQARQFLIDSAKGLPEVEEEKAPEVAAPRRGRPKKKETEDFE